MEILSIILWLSFWVNIILLARFLIKVVKRLCKKQESTELLYGWKKYDEAMKKDGK